MSTDKGKSFVLLGFAFRTYCDMIAYFSRGLGHGCGECNDSCLLKEWAFAIKTRECKVEFRVQEHHRFKTRTYNLGEEKK